MAFIKMLEINGKVTYYNELPQCGSASCLVMRDWTELTVFDLMNDTYWCSWWLFN